MLFWLGAGIGAAVAHLHRTKVSAPAPPPVAGSPKLVAAPVVEAKPPRAMQAATLLTALAAIAAVVFTGLQLQATRAQIDITEQGQVTDRYSKAVQQLGDDKLDVRLGGIYALERIAKDSPRDQPTIVEILSSYVRDHVLSVDDPACPRPPAPPIAGLSTDLTATITVLNRREHSSDRGATTDLRRVCIHSDLTGSDLSGIDFSRADLSGAILTRADLSDAILVEAQMSALVAPEAHFNRAVLIGAHIQEADVSGAVLTGANLSGANLSGANLSGANLSGANLSGANLTGANLTGANLTGANLTGANLTGALGR